MSCRSACLRQALLRPCHVRAPFSTKQHNSQLRCPAASRTCRRLRTRDLMVVASAPQPDIGEAPADAPQEWDTPMPSKRPDIFPEFEKLETVLPKPLPGDPELPDEELEEEKIKAPPPGDPEPVDPDNPEPEDPEKDDDLPERPQPDLPRIPN